MIIPLRESKNAAHYRVKPLVFELLWLAVQKVFFYTDIPYPNALKRQLLRWFGAKVGRGVIIKPSVRVLFPWKLEIGHSSWIGEGVQIHNHEWITLGHDVVLSQNAFLTTGTHAARSTMDMEAHPIVIGSGAWVCANTVVTHGVEVGTSALVLPGTVVYKSVPAGRVVRSHNLVDVGPRFPGGPTP